MDEKLFNEKFKEVKDSLIVDTNEHPFYMLNVKFFRNAEDYSLYERLVYIDLACYAGQKKNTAFPSTATIAKNLGISRRTVFNTLKSLEEKEVILTINRIWENKSKTSNMYVLASIDLNTGKIIKDSLKPYKKFKEEVIKVYNDKEK